MRFKPLNRRTFLRGLGGAAISLPFLNAMETKQVIAAPFPKRLVIFFSANGTIPGNWIPSGGEGDFTLSPILAPLEPHKQELLVLQGLDNEAAHHGPGDGHQTGMGCMLTGTELLQGTEFCEGDCSDPTKTVGWGGGPSVDQVVAAQVGQESKFSSLEFGVQVQSSSIWSRMSYLAADQPLPPEDDPQAGFDRIFGELGADPFGLAKLRAQRHSVLDSVISDYETLNKRVGSEDKKKLDNHLTAIREIEKRLDAGGQLGGSCQLPDLGGPVNDIYANDNFPAMGRLQMDLLVMSLACNLTRVASIQWSTSVSNKVFSWLGIPDGHHDLSHNGDTDAVSQGKITQINTWYAEQFAYLVAAMKAVPEGDGTMLDNTVIMWCNELGVGNSHTRRDMPFVLAGSCGGYFKTGRFLQYDDTERHNNLLLSLCHAMDVNETTFGNPAYCTGPLSKLTG
jgi:Protein of unknown function (DUF1552)